MTNLITINLSKVQLADVSAMQAYPLGTDAGLDYDLYQFNTIGGGIEGGVQYKLLHYLSSQIFENTLILDVGTRAGHSAHALALSRRNRIYTYDIIDSTKYINYLKGILKYDNIFFKQLDINLESTSVLLESELIVLDIDPHDGIQEDKFFFTLDKIGYQGLVLLDDSKWESMQPFIKSIRHTTFDATKYGHSSGSLFVDFSDGKKFRFIE